MDIVYELCADLIENLSETESVEDKERLINKYIDQVVKKVGSVNDFRAGLEWFNVSSPLSIHTDLAGKVVLLDFFTYCCINCLHVLPDLKTLEEKYTMADGLVLIGVHSAKFEAEKISSRVGAAVKRHGILHPVVNDVSCDMWQELNIACWPTLLLLGPGGRPLFVLMGEGHSEILELFVRVSLAYFSSNSKLSREIISKIVPSSHLAASSGLSFPGSVALNKDHLAISDSGHHRILVVNLASKVVKVTIGSGGCGLQDGSFEQAKFNTPQGLAWLDDNIIYVADTENHAIRKINLSTRQVMTVAGIGKMGSDREGGQIASASQPLNSPWGLSFDESRKMLLIAMAGTHQIWGLTLDKVKWWKAREFEGGICVALAGSGREENRNSGYPMAAGFAQPSGLALASQRLFVADSESSSIRQINLSDGKVVGLVGGEKDPLNLFAFGDTDGHGTFAKLQHPLDVAWSENQKLLYVADTFNNKIKKIDLESGLCSTLNLQNVNKLLCEPGGLCVDDSRNILIVADTNNHAIKLIDLNDNCNTTELTLAYPSKVDSGHVTSTFTRTATVSPKGGSLTLEIVVNLPSNIKPAPDAPQSWKLEPLPGSWNATALKGGLFDTENTLKGETHLQIPAGSDPYELNMTLNVMSCDKSAGQCRMHRLAGQVTIERSTSQQDQSVSLNFNLL